jgi:signal transduction histidine kinase/CheY-like chemotaxis protein
LSARARKDEIVSSRISDLVEVLPEPSFLLTAQGELLFVNGAAADLIGGDFSSMVGTRIQDFSSDAPAAIEDYLKTSSSSRQLIPGTLKLRGKNGGPIHVQCHACMSAPNADGTPGPVFLRCHPVGDEHTDRFAQMSITIGTLSQEIFDLKIAAQQLDESLHVERGARMEAERAGRVNDEFLATLSHQLRNPLDAILGWANLLGSKSLDPAVAEGVEVITRNSRLQKQLIDELLDRSRIVSGKMRLDVQRVELGGIIDAAILAIRPAADAKNVRIQSTLDPLAGPVKGDPGRLQQIVWELLRNAVKFTPGGARVQVSLERVNSHLEIVVSDSGQGIEAELLPNVFDRFRQSDPIVTRNYGGHGLGLTIVKNLVELHGGSVRAKSPGRGQGSTFIVALPLILLHADGGTNGGDGVHPSSVAHAGDAVDEVPNLNNVDILVVDDEPDARDLLTQLLGGYGAMVRAARSVREAIDLFEASKPDLLISDIGMPEMDGYALIRVIRQKARAEGGEIPAIALTAFARSEDRMRAMIAGYNLHLAKPIEPTELVVAAASLAARTGKPRLNP